MVELIEDKTEIDKIIKEKIEGKRLFFTDWYREGILRKGIEHATVLKIFPKFDKVTKIEKEELILGYIGYELFYKISNNTTFSIATSTKNNKVLIIHAVEYKRKLDNRFKKFKL